MFSRIKWILLTRLLIKKKIKGFSASKESFATGDCIFSEYNKLHGTTFLSNVSLGRFTYVVDAKITNAEIGAFCSIASGVKIGLGMHPTNFLSTHPVFYSTRKQVNCSFVNENKFLENKKTNIGNDVWIGANVIVLDGIKIANGAIIAAGSVVTKDIAPYSIVGGVPAKTIRMRFSPTQILYYESLNWHSWSTNEIRKNINLFNIEII